MMLGFYQFLWPVACGCGRPVDAARVAPIASFFVIIPRLVASLLGRISFFPSSGNVRDLTSASASGHFPTNYSRTKPARFVISNYNQLVVSQMQWLKSFGGFYVLTHACRISAFAFIV